MSESVGVDALAELLLAAMEAGFAELPRKKRDRRLRRLLLALKQRAEGPASIAKPGRSRAAEAALGLANENLPRLLR